jgi:nicotinate-nucleotide adenylyltransferase
MLIGADQYEKLDSWHRARDLFSLCTFAVFGRPTSVTAAAEQPRPGVVHVEMEPIPISATEIRWRIARSEDVSAELPLPVLRYIQRNHLYGHP